MATRNSTRRGGAGRGKPEPSHPGLGFGTSTSPTKSTIAEVKTPASKPSVVAAPIVFVKPNQPAPKIFTYTDSSPDKEVEALKKDNSTSNMLSTVENTDPPVSTKPPESEDKPEDKTDNKIETKTDDKIEEKPSEDKTKDKPEDKTKDKPEDKTKDKLEDKVKDKPEDKVKDKPEDKVKDKPEDKVKDKPEDKVKDKPEDKVKDKPEDKTKDKPEAIVIAKVDSITNKVPVSKVVTVDKKIVTAKPKIVTKVPPKPKIVYEDWDTCKLCFFKFFCVEDYRQHCTGIMHKQRLTKQATNDKIEKHKELTALANIKVTKEVQIIKEVIKPKVDPKTTSKVTPIADKKLTPIVAKKVAPVKQDYPLKRPLPSSSESKELFCDLCVISCTGQANFDMHVQGQRHQKNLMQDNITGGYADMYDTGIPKKTTTTTRRSNRVAQLDAKLKDWKVPLIGLKYVVEIQKDDPNMEPRYFCELCDSKSDPRTLITHLTGVKHRQKYMRESYPEKLAELVANQTKKSATAPILEAMSLEIEELDGRTPLRVQVESETVGPDMPMKRYGGPPGPDNFKRPRMDDDFMDFERPGPPRGRMRVGDFFENENGFGHPMRREGFGRSMGDMPPRDMLPRDMHPREREMIAREREMIARDREREMIARDQEMIARDQEMRARDRDREMLAAREREMMAAREREIIAAREREMIVARDRLPRDMFPREREMIAREMIARDMPPRDMPPRDMPPRDMPPRGDWREPLPRDRPLAPPRPDLPGPRPDHPVPRPFGTRDVPLNRDANPRALRERELFDRVRNLGLHEPFPPRPRPAPAMTPRQDSGNLLSSLSNLGKSEAIQVSKALQALLQLQSLK